MAKKREKRDVVFVLSDGVGDGALHTELVVLKCDGPDDAANRVAELPDKSIEPKVAAEYEEETLYVEVDLGRGIHLSLALKMDAERITDSAVNVVSVPASK